MNARNAFGRTPLSVAASTGNETIVELLLKQKDVELKIADRYRRTPLHHAA